MALTFGLATTLPADRYGTRPIAYNGYLYVVGGYSGSSLNGSVIFAPINANGTLGSWTSTSTLPANIRSLECGVHSGRLYAIGGINDSSSAVNTVYKATINANGTLGSWSSAGTLPTAWNHPGAFINNGRLVLTGGAAQTTCYSSAFDGSGNLGSWSSLGAFPVSVSFARALLVGGYVHVFSPNYSASGYYYASWNGTSLGSWSSLQQVPDAADSNIALTDNFLVVLPSVSTNTIKRVPVTAPPKSYTQQATDLQQNGIAAGYGAYVYFLSAGLSYYANINQLPPPGLGAGILGVNMGMSF